METMDVFDLFLVHEDGYTNLLKYLYENIEHFKKRFLSLFFADNPDNIIFKTRCAYTCDQNRTIGKKSVPDIVLYNNDHFCIIEVKVFASEGDDQTLRYYEAKDEIMKSLGINAPEDNQKFFFLSLNSTADLSSKRFCPISWSKIGDCLKGCEAKDALTSSIIQQLEKRISSINGSTITDESNWVNSVRGEKWSMATDLLKALTINRQIYKKEGWASFKKASNEYSLSTYIMPFKEWEGCSLKDQEGHYLEFDILEESNPKLYYSIHNEFEYNPDNNYLSFRLDYELNPYHSKKELRDISNENIKKFAKTCNDFRRNIAFECKKIWNVKYSASLKNCGYEDCHYNGHITDSLLVLISGKVKIKPNWTVRDVNKIIEPFMKMTEKFVNNELLPRIKGNL